MAFTPWEPSSVVPLFNTHIPDSFFVPAPCWAPCTWGSTLAPALRECKLVWLKQTQNDHVKHRSWELWCIACLREQVRAG